MFKNTRMRWLRFKKLVSTIWNIFVITMTFWKIASLQLEKCSYCDDKSLRTECTYWIYVLIENWPTSVLSKLFTDKPWRASHLLKPQKPRRALSPRGLFLKFKTKKEIRINTRIPNSMPAAGVEPALPCGNGILSPARLPIPPCRPAYYKTIISNNF